MRQVINVEPDMTEIAFIGVLKAAGSPALSSAHAVYQYCISRHVSPAFLLAMFQHESGFGLHGWAAKTFSWGNTRPPSFGAMARGAYDQDSGAFLPLMDSIAPPRRLLSAYHDWSGGGISTVARFVEHNAYQGKTTAEAIIPIWAPSSDGNNPAGYVAAVLASMATWTQEQANVKRIAIAAGHHNRDGGDQYEYQQTGKLAAAVAEACRALGMEVVLLTPDDGAGMFPGGIWDVAAAAVALTPAPDIFLECHTEGGGSTGVFAIYPDAPGDLDTDVRDLLGPDVAQRIAAATGLGLGGPQRNGLMSEKQTGVGGQGFRLGIFNKTAPLKETCTRLIIEYGAHDKQPDLGISQRPDFYAQCGRATAEAFAVFLGLPSAVQAQEAVTKPPPVTDPGFPNALQLDGRTVLNGVDFAGTAVCVEVVTVQVRNAAGDRFTRRWRGHALDNWEVI